MPLLPDNARSLYAALVIAAILVAALVLGREVLVPIAIGALIAFMLSPIVIWLAARRVPQALSAVGLLLCFLMLVLSLSAVLSTQLLTLADDFVTHQQNAMDKIRVFAGAAKGDGVIKRVSDVVDTMEKSIRRELAVPAEATSTPSPSASEVLVVDTREHQTLLESMEPLTHPIGQAGLALLFSLFILMQGQDLRDRISRLFGTHNLSLTTSALGDAAERLSQLFLAQAMMNLGFGIVVGIALWLVGVPNALLWAALSALMRFVPYIGSSIAAAPPVILAAAIDPGWSMAILALLIFVVGELTMSQVVEPFLLGARAGLSPLAMLVSASFWALIWGPIGLILAAPLTTMLVVVGRYVSGLEFFSVLLGDEPALTPEEQLYQRLLSGNVATAIQQIEVSTGDLTQAGVADSVVLPALRLAALDWERGLLDRPRADEIRATMHEVVELTELGHATEPVESRPRLDGDVLVVPARSQFDVAAAEYAAHALGSMLSTTVTAADSSGLTAIGQAAAGTKKAAVVVLISIGDRVARYLPLIAGRAARDLGDARLFLLSLHGLSLDNSGEQTAVTFRTVAEVRTAIEQALANSESDVRSSRPAKVAIEGQPQLVLA